MCRRASNNKAHAKFAIQKWDSDTCNISFMLLYSAHLNDSWNNEIRSPVQYIFAEYRYYKCWGQLSHSIVASCTRIYLHTESIWCYYCQLHAARLCSGVFSLTGSDNRREYFDQLQQPLDLFDSDNSIPRERCDPDVSSCFGNLLAAQTENETIRQPVLQRILREWYLNCVIAVLQLL